MCSRLNNSISCVVVFATETNVLFLHSLFWFFVQTNRERSCRLFTRQLFCKIFGNSILCYHKLHIHTIVSVFSQRTKRKKKLFDKLKTHSILFRHPETTTTFIWDIVWVCVCVSQNWESTNCETIHAVTLTIQKNNIELFHAFLPCSYKLCK